MLTEKDHLKAAKQRVNHLIAKARAEIGRLEDKLTTLNEASKIINGGENELTTLTVVAPSQEPITTIRKKKRPRTAHLVRACISTWNREFSSSEVYQAILSEGVTRAAVRMALKREASKGTLTKTSSHTFIRKLIK